MGRRRNDPLKRKDAIRDYRKVVWVSAEGKTEKDYLKMDVFRGRSIPVKFPENIHPSRRNPDAVLKRLHKALGKNRMRKDDQAWVLIDVDTWNRNEIEGVLRWASEDERFHVAISNPKFELFLVLHFENGNGCTTSQATDSRLKRYMPDYDKVLSHSEFNEQQIERAIARAKNKRQSCRAAIPDEGMTDMYALAELLLKEQN